MTNSLFSGILDRAANPSERAAGLASAGIAEELMRLKPDAIPGVTLPENAYLSTARSMLFRFSGQKDGSGIFALRNLQDPARSKFATQLHGLAEVTRAGVAHSPNWSFRNGDKLGRLVAYGEDEARWNQPQGENEGAGALIEETAATNLIENVWGVGLAPGNLGTDAGASLPTKWSLAGATASEWTARGRGASRGWPYVELEYTGADSFMRIYMNEAGAAPATAGQDYIAFCGLQVVDGLFADAALGLRVEFYDSGDNFLESDRVDAEDLIDGDLRGFFVSVTAPASTAYARLCLRVEATASTTIRFRVFAGNLKNESTLSAPVISAEDVIEQASRAAETPGGLTCERASRALFFDWNFEQGGACFGAVEFLENVPVVGRALQRWKGVSTNLLSNPGFEGAAAPSTLPTNHNFTGASATEEIVGRGRENRVPYVDVRFANGSANSNFGLVLDQIDTIPAEVGDEFTLQGGFRLMAGDWSNVTNLQIRLRERNGGSYGSAHDESFTASEINRNQHRRWYLTATMADGATDYVVPFFLFDATGAYDFTVRFYAGQLEEEGYPTSLILPPPGVVAMSTRDSDQITLEAAPYLGDQTQCTTYIRARSAHGSDELEGFVLLANVGDDDGDNLMAQFAITEGGFNGRVRQGGSTDFDQSSANVPAAGHAGNMAMSVEEDNVRLAIKVDDNAVETFDETSLTVPTMSNPIVKFAIARHGALIEEFGIIPAVLTDAEVSALVQ